MVLCRRVGCGDTGEEWRGRIAVECVSKLDGIVAIVGVLNLEDRLFAILGEEDFAVFLADALLRGGLNGDEPVGAEGDELLVGGLGPEQKFVRMVAGEAQRGGRVGLVLEHFGRRPQAGLGLEHEGCALGGAALAGCGVARGERLGGRVGVGHDEVEHLPVGGAGELLGMLQRVVGMVDDGNAAVEPPEQVIVVAAEEVGLAHDTRLLVAVGDAALVGKQLVDGLNLGEIGVPVVARPVGELEVAAFEQVAVAGIEPVALAHGELIAEPRHVVFGRTLHQRDAGHEGFEARPDAVVPGIDVLVEQHGVVPDLGFGDFIDGSRPEDVVAGGQLGRARNEESSI